MGSMITHTEFVTDILSDENYNKHMAIYENGNPYPDKYDPTWMNKAAFDAISQEDGTMVHVCVALNCCRSTLVSWMKRHPPLTRAMEAGRQIGEVKFREKLKQYAFEPSSQVNNGLIKMIANNVHGISDAEASNIILNVNGADNTAPEESARLYQDYMGRGDESVIEVDFEEVDE